MKKQRIPRKIKKAMRMWYTSLAYPRTKWVNRYFCLHERYMIRKRRFCDEHKGGIVATDNRHYPGSRSGEYVLSGEGRRQIEKIINRATKDGMQATYIQVSEADFKAALAKMANK